MESGKSYSAYASYIAMGCSVLYAIWWLSIDVPFYPRGADWSQYIMGAEYLWRWDAALTYPDWRHPLYPYLLGLFAVDSYAVSARLLNAFGVFLGLGAFALVGLPRQKTWWTVVGMVLWLAHPLVQDARDWINPYLLWGGVLAMFAALTVRLLERPQTVAFAVLTWLFGSIGLWLDGRTIWLVGVCLLVLVLSKQWRLSVWLALGWGGSLFAEHLFLNQYQISVHSLWTQLELQRAYLFRPNMAEQLFPPIEDVGSIAETCQSASPAVWSLNMDCALSIWVGNGRAWLAWGLLPPLWLMGVIALGLGFSKTPKWLLGFCVVIVPMGLSLLVWQPPRYLFWTLGLWLGLLVVSLDGLWQGEKTKWLGGVGLIMVGHWLWSAPDLNSLDQPKDWRSTGRLVSEQVGDVVLDCTGRGYTMSQLSSHRPRNWSLVANEGDCAGWLQSGQVDQWGVDTILSEHRFSAPTGWTLETGFDFKAGVLWMYRRQ